MTAERSASKSAGRNHPVRRLVYAAVCLALALLLPFLTGQLPSVGSALCPMHLPVLLAGFLCGPWWGMAVGAAAPLLRSVIFGAPPMFPKAASMVFELAVYGLVSALLYRALPRKAWSVWVALAAAMLAGRLVWGGVMAIFAGVSSISFGWAAFWAGGFAGAVPGIAVQLALIPPIVLALKKAGLTET